jgi:hypothetical protein
METLQMTTTTTTDRMAKLAAAKARLLSESKAKPSNGKSTNKSDKPNKKAKNAEPPAKTKPSSKPTNGKKVKPEKEEKTKKNGKPGIIAHILKMLTEASEKEPVTKAAIFDSLCKTFDNPPESMKSTINHQVPTYLTYAGHDIRKNSNGYWGFHKDQPETKKPAKKSKK